MKYEYNGVGYQSLRELCEDLGLDLLRFSVMRSGNPHLTLEQIVERYLEAGGEHLTKQPVTVWGVRYESFAQLAKSKGIVESNLWHARTKGLSIEQAVMHCLSVGVEYGGVQYASLSHLCATVNVSYEMVVARIGRGYDLVRAVQQPKGAVSRSTSCVVLGVSYASIVEAAESHGYGATFVRRMQTKYKFNSIEETIVFLNRFFSRYGGERRAILTSIPYVIYNGIWFDTRIKFERACGIQGILKYPTELKSPLKRMRATKEAVKTLYLCNDKWLTYSEGRQIKGFTYWVLLTCPQKEVPLYPGCTFNPTGYCADLSLDWEGYIKARLLQIGEG